MDDGHKQKLIVAGLAALALGAGSYFTLTGNSAPPPERQTERTPRRPHKPEAPPSKIRRHEPARRPGRPATPTRVTRHERDQPKKALEHLDKILRIDQKYARALELRARILLRFGQKARAFVDLRALLRINPKHAWARQQLNQRP